ncbi:MAG: hypothetical protein LBN01_00280 [Endomicrobium sp.]|nr:hypothetical protein [Endomicrobium sp.]
MAKYLELNTSIIEHLKNWRNFKKKIWASFFKEIETVYNDIVETISQAQPELKKIREAAMKESSKWETAVEIFKNRFCIPFEIAIDNKIDMMLNGEEVPSLSFKFVNKHTSETIPIQKDDLYRTLSTGERKALYILNIIFEIEARKELKTKTFLIFDDIADSFDYKNKYAIIHYLYELKSYQNSYQIILTHNFDFFRTIVSRLNIKRKFALYPEMTSTNITLKEMPYQKDLFKVWRNELDKSKSKLIASIPFMRNISEYCGMEDEKNKLTALLHINPKICPKTNEITIKNLEEIIKSVLKRNNDDFTLENTNNNLKHDKKVKDVIYDTAEDVSKCNKNPYLLENKIVLSIAIRLKTEEFIINSLSKIKEDIVDYCTQQTFNLIQNYQNHFKDLNKEVLTKVQLITPENIHLNAFMYEPVLDTGYESLVNLYSDVKNLTV